LERRGFGPDFPGTSNGTARTIGCGGAAASRKFSAKPGWGALNSHGRVKLTNDMSTRLSPWPKARKSHGDAFPCILIACTALHQNAPWEEDEPRAGITSTAWSGAHGLLVEDSRKAFPNGQTPSPTLIFLQTESWRIHGEILSLSIAYPFRTLTPICSFCAESRAGRSMPATAGRRVPAAG
jgi:hypothetical protein